MKFKQLLEGLLLEANAKDILMTKAGLNEYNADLLVNTFGKIAIKIFNKILEGAIKLNTENPNIPIVSGVNRYEGDTLKDKILAYFNDRRGAITDYFGGREEMTSLRDYIRVGLNNNYTQIQDLSIMEMVEKAKEWHEEMGGGTSDFNYEEENEVVLDFRENGVGYYWAYLGARDCPKEAKRMGHCASSGGYLYSLREYKKIDEKHTLNRSVLTASIDSSDILIQLKGKSNSKPKDEYFPYIYKLLWLKKEEGDYLINGFGCEYKCENDFQLSDLNEDEIKFLFENRPELFKRRRERKILYDLGLAERNKNEGKFNYHIDVDDIEDYLKGASDYRGNLIKSVLTGETWDLWNNYEYADWKYALKNEIDNENLNKIKNMLNDSSLTHKEYDDLEDEIENSDNEIGYEIQRAIRDSINQAENDEYVNWIYNQIKDCLESYGNLIELTDDGADLVIDLFELARESEIDDDVLDEALEDCNDDLSCAFYELFRDNEIVMPRFNLDDRYYPSYDDNNFNEILRDRLNEI